MLTIYAFDKIYIRTPTMVSQDSAIICKSLISRLSNEGKDRVMVLYDKHKIYGYGSGILILKVVLRESHIGKNATTTTFRLNLSDLDK